MATLYRTHRPQRFNDVVGQEHVTTTLTNQIRRNRIAHAYLFTGPRGVGKTTTARLLAKAVNAHDPKTGEPDEAAETTQLINQNKLLDLVEIDGASNRRIDEIRSLREHIKYPPNIAKYKVFIIDEVHMLTTEAFNALLKTLEEPPEYVIFILATTELHKLPDTIVSRCQKFDFRLVDTNNLLQRLEYLCKAEGVTIEPPVLHSIIRMSGGSVRDAESILGQLLSLGAKSISEKDAAAYLPQSTRESLVNLWSAFVQQDLAQSLAVIQDMVAQGISMELFFDDWLELLRCVLLLAAGQEPQHITIISSDDWGRMRDDAQKISVDILKYYVTVNLEYRVQLAHTAIPQLPLELAVITCLSNNSKQPPLAGDVVQADATRSKPVVPQSAPAEVEQPKSNKQGLLAAIAKKNAAIAQYLQTADISETTKAMVITVGHAFHYEILKKPTQLESITEVMQKFYKTTKPITVTLNKTSKETSKEVDIASLSAQNLANSFGGAVVE